MIRKNLRSIVAKICAVVLAVGLVSGQLAVPVQAEQEPMKTNYSAFMYNNGWSATKDDNAVCAAGGGSYVTAMKASLLNQPEGMTGTIAYQVNLSGSGWLDWVENNAETGATDTAMPLESIRMKLTGQLSENYDIYYAVFQNGVWTDWALNEAPAGTEGAGLRVDGIRVSVVSKGAEAPEMTMGLDPNRPMVALTFDDGPSSAVTGRILNSLEANGGRATFFMVGSRVSGAKECVQRMIQLGCQVGNHTYDHKDLTKQGAAGIRSQVDSTSQKIIDACGVGPTVVRPPYGASNSAVLSALGSMGMSSILWDIDTLDWKTKNAQNTINEVLSKVKDGDIVLMHDIYGTSADAAEVIIPELIKRGYQLVTVEEMAQNRGGLHPGHSYGRFRP